MHLEPKYAIDEGDLESVTYNIFSHRLSEEEGGFGLRNFEPTPRLEGFQVGVEIPTVAGHACCYSDGSCSMLHSFEECFATGGRWKPDKTCDPNPCGACCRAVGWCDDMTEADCLTNPFNYYYSDRWCNDPGQPGFCNGCCTAEGGGDFCGTQGECELSGGSFSGIGTVCPDIECSHGP